MNSPVSELHKAAYNGDIETVKRLITQGADINQRCQDGASPLMHAVVEYQYEVCEYLLLQGADMSLKDNEGDNVFELAEAWPDILELLNRFRSE